MKTSFAIFAVSVSLLAGCSTNMPPPPVPSGQSAISNQLRVTLSRDVAGFANVLQVIERRTESGFLKVEANVQNRTSDPRSFHYKFEWLDAGGMTVSTPTAVFIPAQMEARETISITGVAPTAAVTDFRLKLVKSN